MSTIHLKISMIKSLLSLAFLFAVLISCKEIDDESVKIEISWELVPEMSNRNLMNGKVVNDNLILFSKDSVLTFNNQQQIIKTMVIPGRKSAGTHSAYSFNDLNLLAVPTYYEPNSGRLDSLAIDFYSLEGAGFSSVEYRQIPGTETKGYVTPVNTSCCREIIYNFMSSDNNRFSILLHGFTQSDSSQTDNSDNYYHVLRIKIDNTEPLQAQIEKMIEVPELPSFESFEKYDLLSYQNYDFVITADGTYLISENGYQDKLPSSQAMYLNEDKLFQLRDNSLYSSLDGLTWEHYVDFSNNLDWSATRKVQVIDNFLIDYLRTKWLKKADVETGISEEIINKGLPDSESSFLIDYNGFLYLGLDNGSVYRINKEEIFKD